MNDFAGRVAVITGAGLGLGREFARLTAAPIEEAAAELRGQGASVLTQVCDVGKSDEVTRLADRAFAQLGAVNLLFNHAGVAGGGFVWEATDRDWAWVMASI